MMLHYLFRSSQRQGGEEESFSRSCLHRTLLCEQGEEGAGREGQETSREQGQQGAGREGQEAAVKWAEVH